MIQYVCLCHRFLSKQQPRWWVSFCGFSFFSTSLRLNQSTSHCQIDRCSLIVFQYEHLLLKKFERAPISNPHPLRQNWNNIYPLCKIHFDPAFESIAANNFDDSIYRFEMIEPGLSASLWPLPTDLNAVSSRRSTFIFVAHQCELVSLFPVFF